MLRPCFLAECLAQLLREVLAHHLFALLPESLCIVGVERIAAHTFVKQAEPCIICNDVTHVAVLAIPSSYLFGGRDDRCPHCGGGSEGNSFELKRLFALRCCLFIDLFDHLFHLRRVHVAGKLGLYASWMYGRRADPALMMPLIESNCEEDVGGLRAPVSQEGFVMRGLKVGIVQVDIAETVP